MPEGVGAFVLIMDDPDAPPGLWIHWVLYNLPPELRELPPGLPPDERLANGALHGACWGVESFSRLGDAGPLPPPGPAHRYRFRLTALKAPSPGRPAPRRQRCGPPWPLMGRHDSPWTLRAHYAGQLE